MTASAMTGPQKSWQSGLDCLCQLPRLSRTITVSAPEAGADMARHNNKGRSKRSLAPFVGLERYMLDSAAWCSLSAVERAAYLEVAKLYNGTNNGQLAMSGRRLAEHLHVSKASGTRALSVLAEKGFLEVVKPSAFSLKTKRATEYRLTAHRCDVSGSVPSKAFMKWQPRKNRTRRHVRPTTASPQAHRPSTCK